MINLITITITMIIIENIIMISKESMNVKNIIDISMQVILHIPVMVRVN